MLLGLQSGLQNRAGNCGWRLMARASAIDGADGGGGPAAPDQPAPAPSQQWRRRHEWLARLPAAATKQRAAHLAGQPPPASAAAAATGPAGGGTNHTNQSDFSTNITHEINENGKPCSFGSRETDPVSVGTSLHDRDNPIFHIAVTPSGSFRRGSAVTPPGSFSGGSRASNFQHCDDVINHNKMTYRSVVAKGRNSCTDVKMTVHRWCQLRW